MILPYFLQDIHDPTLSAKMLNDDLSRIFEWVHRWKMLFNPDITNQVQEVTFSRKNTKNDHPIVYFNEVPVAYTTCQKHLGMHLDEKLNFSHHVKEKIDKANKGIRLICKLPHVLPRKTIFKFQYNAALAITGAIKGTSKLKIYNELDNESLKFRRWFRHLCMFFKIKTTQIPNYLYEFIPSESHIYSTRNSENVETNYCKTDQFKYSFFRSSIIEWNKLRINLHNAKSFLIFRNSLSKIGRQMQSSVYIHQPAGIKYLTRLRFK